MSERCTSIHKWSGVQCVRPAGHDGLCWDKAKRGADGRFLRALWLSRDGRFRSHHAYIKSRGPSRVSPADAGEGA